MTGHVFLSYSHASDGEYVELLAEHLSQQGVTVWFDREIISGDRWASLIEAKIDSCAAMIVVMSPAANESAWVNREINQAEEMGKPIHPLLLSGRRFFRLSDFQYEDVTGGQMPPARFVDRLRGHQPGQLTPVELPPDEATLESLYEDADAMGKRGDHADAIRLFRYVAASRSRVLGADRIGTIMSRYQLAYYTALSGDWADAAELFGELLPDWTRVRGADDYISLRIRHQLARCIGECGDPSGAVKLFRELLPDRTRVRGADHPETLRTRHELAYWTGQSGDHAGAFKLLRDLLPDRTRVLGAEHVETKDTNRLMQSFG